MFETGMRDQRGFTLIEMSIVLVIIGLIIGGILKGQELIESARQKNLISQIDSMRAAVTTFTDRYRSFPGDYSSATANISGCGSCGNGNDDGLLNANPGGTTANLMAVNGVGSSSSTNEIWWFFAHMIGSDLMGGAAMIDSASTPTNFAGGATPSPLPAAAYPQSGMDIVYGTHAGATSGGSAIRTHWLRLHRFIAGSVTSTQAIVSPNRLFQLDQKYDDGAAVAGRIRTGDDAAGCNATGSNTYVASTTSVACNIVISLE